MGELKANGQSFALGFCLKRKHLPGLLYAEGGGTRAAGFFHVHFSDIDLEGPNDSHRLVGWSAGRAANSSGPGPLSAPARSARRVADDGPRKGKRNWVAVDHPAKS